MGSGPRLRPVEELVEIGYGRSDLVLLNEAHDGFRRCVRTRRIGSRILPTAHRLGIRHLAMEALWDRALVGRINRQRVLPAVQEQSYLAPPEMRSFIQAALDLGWTLHGYEANIAQAPRDRDPTGMAFTNWRETAQAENLAGIARALPSGSRLLVWCGNHHQLKAVAGLHGDGSWYPMGWHLVHELGLDPFVVDQAITVEFRRMPARMRSSLTALTPDLRALGGTAGYLNSEAPEPWCREGTDAVVLSLHNQLE